VEGRKGVLDRKGSFRTNVISKSVLLDYNEIITACLTEVVLMVVVAAVLLVIVAIAATAETKNWWLTF